MKKRLMIIALMLFSVAANGYGGDLIDGAIGIWHFQNKNLFKGITEEHYFEITETAILHDAPEGQNRIDSALAEKDGSVVARYAGTEREAFVIKVIDANTLRVWFSMYGEKTLKRSSTEARIEGIQKNAEVVAANKPKPLEWGNVATNPASGYTAVDTMLMGPTGPVGVIRPDGTVTTMTRDAKTGNYEVVGHVTDYIPDWKSK